jgi:hypothetical protein
MCITCKVGADVKLKKERMEEKMTETNNSIDTQDENKNGPKIR